MSDIDADIVKAFMEVATASGDPDQIVAMISKLQTLMVSMFSLYILIQAKEHEDHDDCETMRELPKAIDSFITQLTDDIRLHVGLNLKVNGVVFEKTANQKQYEEILAEIAADKR